MKGATNATAREALQQKEDIVVTYYRQVWNIDFYSLQNRVQTALKLCSLTRYFRYLRIRESSYNGKC
jgi:hypothetical protein